jgi:hypothetical protein
MYQPSSTPANSSKRSSPGLTQLRLHGIGLGFARAVWAIMVVLLLAFFLANLPVYAAQLQTVCLHPRCAPWQLAPASVTTLQRLHLSLGGYALVSLLISIASVCVWCAVAAVIFWRQSQLGMALLMALLLVVQGITQMSDPIQTPLEYTAQGWQRAAVLGATLDLSLALIVFSVFPNGRFVPGWMRWLVALLTATLWIYVFATAASVPWATVLNPVTIGSWAAVMGSIIGAQIYRYRRVSTWAERQQTKWVVLGMIEGVLVGVLYFVPPQVFPTLGQPGSLYVVLARPGYTLLFLFAPISIGIALLRYHLWDIDVIINRTLVYGSLSAILAAIYLGSILTIESLLALLTRQAPQAQSPVAIVVSTLVIAALFQPLRHRLQQLIDRRFYRSKYNAEQTLSAFAVTLKSEVELPTLQQKLLEIVGETMQPSSISLWLRPAPSPPPSESSPTATWQIMKSADPGGRPAAESSLLQ